MNWRAFIISLFQALVWPSVVLVLAFLFREQIRGLFSTSLKSIKTGMIEAEFEQTRKVLELANVEVEKATTGYDLSMSRREELNLVRQRIAAMPPKAAVTVAGQLAESAVTDASRPYVESRAGGSEPISAAQRGGLLSPVGAFAFSQLRELRWKLDQEPDVSQEQALEYIQLVDEALLLLDRGIQQRGQSDASEDQTD